MGSIDKLEKIEHMYSFTQPKRYIQPFVRLFKVTDEITFSNLKLRAVFGINYPSFGVLSLQQYIKYQKMLSNIEKHTLANTARESYYKEYLLRISDFNILDLYNFQTYMTYILDLDLYLDLQVYLDLLLEISDIFLVIFRTN